MSRRKPNTDPPPGPFLEGLLQAWRSVFDTIGDPICLIDLGGRIQRCNHAMSRFLNHPFHQVIGRLCFDFFCGDSGYRLLEDLKTSGLRESTAQFFNHRWYHITLDPYFGERNRLAGAVLTLTDITEQRQQEDELRNSRNLKEKMLRVKTRELEKANRKLRQSRKLYRKIVETANEGIWIIGPDCLTVFVNQKMTAMMGLSVEEMLDRHPRDFLDPEWLKNREGYLLSWRKANSQCEFKFRRRDGSALWTIVSTSPMTEKSHYLGTLAMVTDITPRKRAEDELRSSEERFSTAFNSSPLPMTINRAGDLRCIEVNDSCLSLLGFSRDELLSHCFTELNLWKDPRDRYTIARLLRKQGWIKNQEITLRTKSGAERTGLMCVEPVEMGGKSFFLTVVSDLTELKQLEKEVLRLDRLNLIGEMAASIGHEIRNPITTVRGFLQMLGEKPEYEDLSSHFSLMIDEMDRANSIITEYLSLAKNKALDLKPRNLSMIVNNLLPLIQADALTHDCQVTAELGELPEISLDEKEIRQMILNLTRNSLEAMPGGGAVTISTAWKGTEVVLSVTDQGSGIDPQLLEKIGTPFLTTKEQGTGLGLAVCYSIAARHQASIRVDTGSRGTCFQVVFPTTVL